MNNLRPDRFVCLISAIVDIGRSYVAHAHIDAVFNQHPFAGDQRKITKQITCTSIVAGKPQ